MDHVIDVAFTRADLRPAEIAVVIDVLRATTTAAQALAAGYRRVLCAGTVERALALRTPDRILAGERGCVIPPGFDLGNSPIEAARCHAAELVLATTNGAPTIVAATHHAPAVLLACLRNLDAVIAALRAPDDWRARDVLVVCSGTDAVPAVEDAYVAGRLCAGLQGPRSDAALIAIAVADAYPSAVAALEASANARVLRATGATADIAFCARESVLETLPYVVAADAGVATVVDAAASFSTPNGGEALLAARPAIESGATARPRRS